MARDMPSFERRQSNCDAHRPERTAMNRARPVLLECGEVLAHGITFVSLETVGRVLSVVVEHAGVARGLREDRGSSDRKATFVALDDARLLDRHVTELARVDQQMLGSDAER